MEVIVLTDSSSLFINFINGGKLAHLAGMKPVLCFVMVLVVFAGLAVALVSPLKAQRTKCARYRAGQSPEGSALLAHEWARAHALPGH